MVRIEEVGDDYHLQQAWLELRSGRTMAARQQGAGVDGVTLAAWEEDWQWRLANLRAELLGGAYRPSPLLWFDLPRRSRRPDPGPVWDCLLYTSPSPRDRPRSRLPSSA